MNASTTNCFNESADIISDTQCSASEEPSLFWVKVALVCLLVVLTFFGNILVIVAIVSTKTLRTNATNLFVASLAFSDLLVAAVLVPAAASRDIGKSWRFGNFGCSLFTCFDILGCTASILNLCVISYDRYLAISRPLTYSQMMTSKVVFFLIFCSWFSALMISTVPVLFKWHLSDPSVLPENCELTLNTPYALLSSLISFYIPAVIVLTTNSRVFCIARRHQNSIRRSKRDSTPAYRQKSLEAKQSVSPEPTEHDLMTTRKKKSPHILSKFGKPQMMSQINMKATVTIGIISGLFLLCWSPFFVCNVLFQFCCANSQVFTVVTWIGYVNSCFNPVTLWSFNREYRNAFQIVLRIKKHGSRNANFKTIELDVKP